MILRVYALLSLLLLLLVHFTGRISHYRVYYTTIYIYIPYSRHYYYFVYIYTSGYDDVTRVRIFFFFFHWITRTRVPSIASIRTYTRRHIYLCFSWYMYTLYTLPVYAAHYCRSEPFVIIVITPNPKRTSQLIHACV